ncbi:MAG: alpha/beta fold hydrolase [Anaerolineaceae bacterium]|nr:alpha/beta fold hydrolase [Anaerolineaceae bacterium]
MQTIASRLILAAMAILAVLSACSAPPAKAVNVPQGASAGELTPLEPCEYRPDGDHRFEAQCATLSVAENPADPGTRLIALPVVRIPASGPQPAEPVFFLQGGPGSPNLTWSPPDWLLAEHDVVLVGYRGAEGSVVLDCPPVNRLLVAYTGLGIFGDAARADLDQAVEQCARDWQAEGVDLDGYTAPAVIEDLEAARLALGYPRIHLYSVSYGTRLAQLYAYMHPGSLSRVVMIGMNPPGHFIYDREDFDAMLVRMSGLCAQDPACAGRSSNLAQTIYTVNRHMPDHWLFFPIDPGTIRMATQMMFFSNPTMPLAIDAYLAAGQGDASGMAMLNLMSKFVFPPFIIGDLLNKGGTLDLAYYQGLESVNLGDSVMGAPLSEMIWPMATAWPITLADESLRHLNPSEVEMLIVNGTLDFSTPLAALDEVKPYYSHAQMVRLPEFSHVGDVETLQPQAFQRLISSYYHDGVADDSLYVYQPLQFVPEMSLGKMARLLLVAAVLVLALLAGGLALLVRRVRRARSTN